MTSARALLGIVFFASACSHADSEGPLSYVMRTTADADPRGELPLVIALHGRGDTPEHFLTFFDDLEHPARVVAIRAPIEESDGRAWFGFGLGFRRAMDDLEALLPRVVEASRRAGNEHPTRGRPIVVGFSQGAMIAYALATRHPHEFSAIFPVSGFFPSRFAPSPGQPVAKVRAFHGSRDQVIAADTDRDGIEPLLAHGAELTIVDGAPHWLTRSMRRALFAAMAAHLESAR